MFSYNSKFFQTVNQMIDCVFLSLLWIVFSLPVLTIGAATTALYHAVDKVIRREEGHLFKEFWRVFRRDFKRATILWIFMVLIFCILAANFYAAFIKRKSAGVHADRCGVFNRIVCYMAAVLVCVFGPV